DPRASRAARRPARHPDLRMHRPERDPGGRVLPPHRRTRHRATTAAGTAMTTAIRAEMLKLTTIRLPLGLLATGSVLTAAMALPTAARAGTGASMADAALNTAAGLTGVLATSYFAMIMAMVLGVTIATGEFRHATLTYLATPHRTQVIAAKAVTAFAAGLIFGLAGAAITTGIGLAVTLAKGYHETLAAVTIARYAAGAVLGSGLLASLGTGLGSLIRSHLAAVITVFLWSFLAENTLGGPVHPIAPYLPFMAATSLAGPPP